MDNKVRRVNWLIMDNKVFVLTITKLQNKFGILSFHVIPYKTFASLPNLMTATLLHWQSIYMAPLITSQGIYQLVLVMGLLDLLSLLLFVAATNAFLRYQAVWVLHIWFI